MALTLVTAPVASAEAVTLDEVKHHARADGITADDLWFQDIAIPAALDRAQLESGLQILTATWALKLDEVPSGGWIELPKPPLQSVSGVAYVDTNGTAQTWAVGNYGVDVPAGPRASRGRVSLAYGVSWFTPRAIRNAVTLTFVAGYGVTPQSVPALLRWAIAQDVATMYASRENHVTGVSLTPMPDTSKQVYQSFRTWPTQGLAD